ncbi:MAG: ATP-binding protein [Caldilinea sp. CFX5]|nr:ATP-binding protein [Caldilinea sp. CFX5]
MTALLAERLENARRSRLIKRVAECDLFQSVLQAEQPPFHLLYILGPGGVGKTTLLHEFVHLAEAAHVDHVYLDGRNLEASPEFFLINLQQGMGLTPPLTPLQALAERSARFVLLIDTYELLGGLDRWLRETFLPALPSAVLVVIASRNPPTVEWRADPGWRQLMRVLPVRNLTVDESRLFLEQRRIPADQQATILAFTRGHPLALALIADAFAQHPAMIFQPSEAPDIIAPLLERFIQAAPTPAHRAALEACALVRLTTEPLLAALLDLPDAHDLFIWLRELSFMESEWRGLFPHDLAREAIIADLRWRNPARHGQLQQRARTYYMVQLSQKDLLIQQQALSDYLYLDRDNPLVRAHFAWQESGAIFVDNLRTTDHGPLLAMIEQYEGPVAARLAAHWLTRQPAGARVLRDVLGTPQGFLLLVALDQETAESRNVDPATQSVWRYLERRAPLRTGERATIARFWLTRDGYQGVSPIQSRIFLALVQHALTTPGLAYTFITCADPAFWADVFTYINFARLTETDFQIDGRTYGVFGHDWRALPAMKWLQMVGEPTVTNGAALSAAPQPATTYTILNDEEFAAAVREALRTFNEPAALSRNLLLGARMVANAAGANSSTTQRVAALKALIQKAATELQASPRELKLYRALHHTYFQPAATQEQAAELLDLPFSTYRRHLGAGITYLVEWLQQQERAT